MGPDDRVKDFCLSVNGNEQLPPQKWALNIFGNMIHFSQPRSTKFTLKSNFRQLPIRFRLANFRCFLCLLFVNVAERFSLVGDDDKLSATNLCSVLF